ncbi:MAG: gluconate 2-dehydrogenase subunit 3 family protein [Burkholderiaceae bacterium]
MTNTQPDIQPDTQPIKLVVRKNPLTSRQQQTLARLSDLMIPASADGRMPAASTLGLFDDISDMAESALTILATGLDQLDDLSAEQNGESFHTLNQVDAMSVADKLKPKARAFFATFTVQNVARYYRHETVMPLIGLEPRPPWPLGNPVDDGDWSLLDPVRNRKPFYRQT